jgi:flagellar biogenesis protein FliO
MTEKAIAATPRKDTDNQSLRQQLLGLLRRILRSFQQPPEARQFIMSIEQRIAVGPKQSLILVNCAGRRFLLAMAGDSITSPVEVNSSLKPARQSWPLTTRKKVWRRRETLARQIRSPR